MNERTNNKKKKREKFAEETHIMCIYSYSMKSDVHIEVECKKNLSGNNNIQ